MAAMLLSVWLCLSISSFRLSVYYLIVNACRLAYFRSCEARICDRELQLDHNVCVVCLCQGERMADRERQTEGEITAAVCVRVCVYASELQFCLGRS